MKIAFRVSEPSLPERTWDYSGHKFLIGRDPVCKLCFTGDVVSWRHAEMDLQAAAPVINDLGSTNGTFVNGVRIRSITPLRIGDEVSLGQAGPRLKLYSYEGAVATGQPAGASYSPGNSSSSNAAAAPAPVVSRSNAAVVVAAVAGTVGMLLVGALVALLMRGKDPATIVVAQPGNTAQAATIPVAPVPVAPPPPPVTVTPPQPAGQPPQPTPAVTIDWRAIGERARPGVVWVGMQAGEARVLLAGGWLAAPDKVVVAGHTGMQVKKTKDKITFYVATSLADETPVSDVFFHPLFDGSNIESQSSIHSNVAVLKLASPRPSSALRLASEPDVIKSLANGSDVVVGGYAIEASQLNKPYTRETLPAFVSLATKVGPPDVASASLSPRRILQIKSPPGLFACPVLNADGAVVGMAIQLAADDKYADDPVYCITGNAIREAVQATPY